MGVGVGRTDQCMWVCLWDGGWGGGRTDQCMWVCLSGGGWGGEGLIHVCGVD